MWSRLPSLVLFGALSLGLAGAAVACGGSIPMGALRLPYDPAVWSAAEVGPGHWRLMPHDDDEGATIDVHIVTTACTEAQMITRVADRSDEGRAETRTNSHGLSVVSAEGYTGCRNLTAGPVAACVREQGRTWLFETEHRGCTLTRYRKASPHDLLDGLKREDGAPVYR